MIDQNNFAHLRPYIGDHKTDGKNTVLWFEGFSGEKEVHAFLAALVETGVVKIPKPELVVNNV